MKRIERLKQEIVNMVSHDLRSPLTSLSVMFELFEMGALGSLNEHGERKVRGAREEIVRMVSIVNDLLDIEKFESGAFELDCKPEPVELIVQSAVGAMLSKAEKRGIAIERVDCFGTVFCDKPRIVRVLVNLLDNAIKFSPANSRILVSARELANATEIRVADGGRGIAAEKLQIIFERFKQSERLDEIEKEGSGLGLAICKAIVESHKGTISVHSVVNRGSEFSIVLPFQ
jgi:signal transduction histidine kinase